MKKKRLLINSKLSKSAKIQILTSFKKRKMKGSSLMKKMKIGVQMIIYYLVRVIHYSILISMRIIIID
jgi:hypothetical protein